jgi:hypothetical protein
MSNEYEPEHKQHGHHHPDKPKEEVEGAEAAPPPWVGAPTVITAVGTTPYQVSTYPTDTGVMFVCAINQTTGNNPGTIQWLSGGSSGTLACSAGAQEPTALLQNFNGSQLSLTNVSGTSPDSTPIQVMLAGTGRTSMTKATFGSAFTQYQFCTTTVPAQPKVTIRLTCTSGNAVIGLIGGPGNPPNSGNNGYLISLNSPQGNTGVPSGQPSGGTPATSPWYATTGNNQYDFVITATSGGFTMWLGNLSSGTSNSVTALQF